MRILLVSHAKKDPDAGASRVYHLLEEGLKARGHSVTALHYEDFGVPPAVDRIVSKLFLPHAASRRAARENLSEFDVVMTSSGMLYPLFAKLQGAKKRPLLVSHMHGFSFFDHQARMTEHMRGHMPLSWAYRHVTGERPVMFDEKGSRHADVNIVQNGRDLEFAQDRGFAAPQQIPLTVHPEIAAGAASLPGPEQRDPHALLWFGSWVERKGIFYLPRAFAMIAQRHPEARLTIGGTKMDEAFIKDQFLLELRPKIRVLGTISRNEQIAEFGRHSIFLFPSLSEGFGFALLEAMSLGLAVVTTHTGLGIDFLEDHQSGMIVPAASALHLAGAVNTLIEQPELRCRIARSGQQLSLQFGIDRLLDSFEEAFQQGVNGLRHGGVQ